MGREKVQACTRLVLGAQNPLGHETHPGSRQRRLKVNWRLCAVSAAAVIKHPFSKH
jgi:hypothetical protein